jgi:septation ring formation regulator EzrA
MQTVEWTDGKLEERLERIDERFERVDDRFEETRQRFDRVEGDIRELKQGLTSVQTTLHRFIIGAATGWVVLMATIFAKGG